MLAVRAGIATIVLLHERPLPNHVLRILDLLETRKSASQHFHTSITHSAVAGHTAWAFRSTVPSKSVPGNLGTQSVSSATDFRVTNLCQPSPIGRAGGFRLDFRRFFRLTKRPTPRCRCSRLTCTSTFGMPNEAEAVLVCKSARFTHQPDEPDLVSACEHQWQSAHSPIAGLIPLAISRPSGLTSRRIPHFALPSEHRVHCGMI